METLCDKCLEIKEGKDFCDDPDCPLNPCNEECC